MIFLIKNKRKKDKKIIKKYIKILKDQSKCLIFFLLKYFNISSKID